jgi:hypothetical protein
VSARNAAQVPPRVARSRSQPPSVFAECLQRAPPPRPPRPPAFGIAVGWVVTPRGLGAASRLLADENECQSGDDERREEERQEPLARASEGDDLAVGGVEGLGSA